MEGQGDLVSRSINISSHIVSLVVLVINLLTKSPSTSNQGQFNPKWSGLARVCGLGFRELGWGRVQGTSKRICDFLGCMAGG